MSYYRKAFDIAGYTYRAETLCPTCTIQVMLCDGDASPSALDMREEDVLDQCAGAQGIDRDDEYSFDSGDFPKVIFVSQTDGDRCDRCGEAL